RRRRARVPGPGSRSGAREAALAAPPRGRRPLLSGLGAATGGRLGAHESRGGLPRPRARRTALLLRPPGRRRAPALAQRLRPLRARRFAQPALRRARELRAPRARPGLLARLREHALFRRRRRAALGRRVARRGAAALREERAGARLLPHGVLPAGGDDARRGRRGLALPLPPAPGPLEPRARAAGSPGPGLARRPRPPGAG